MIDRGVRYYVDCTETVCCGLNTGIQRTVRNIIARQSLIRERTGLEVVPVVSFEGTFYRYHADRDRRIFAPLVSRILGAGRDFIDRLFSERRSTSMAWRRCRPQVRSTISPGSRRTAESSSRSER